MKKIILLLLQYFKDNKKDMHHESISKNLDLRISPADFHVTIHFWMSELDKYSDQHIMVKPDDGGWSLGQLYMHLIESTSFFIDQANICRCNNRNQNKSMTPSAREMFIHNALPDIDIEGPPSNALTTQPSNKELVILLLNELEIKYKKAAELTLQSLYRGKTKHPGLHYLSAREWLHFAEMHMRHHVRQKERLEKYLQSHAYMFPAG